MRIISILNDPRAQEELQGCDTGAKIEELEACIKMDILYCNCFYKIDLLFSCTVYGEWTSLESFPKTITLLSQCKFFLLHFNIV